MKDGPQFLAVCGGAISSDPAPARRSSGLGISRGCRRPGSPPCSGRSSNGPCRLRVRHRATSAEGWLHRALLCPDTRQTARTCVPRLPAGQRRPGGHEHQDGGGQRQAAHGISFLGRMNGFPSPSRISCGSTANPGTSRFSNTTPTLLIFSETPARIKAELTRH